MSGIREQVEQLVRDKLDNFDSILGSDERMQILQISHQLALMEDRPSPLTQAAMLGSLGRMPPHRHDADGNVVMVGAPEAVAP